MTIDHDIANKTRPVRRCHHGYRPCASPRRLVSKRIDRLETRIYLIDRDSDIRQIPDTQEVLLYPDSDVSIIVEVLQRVAVMSFSDAAKLSVFEGHQTHI